MSRLFEIDLPRRLPLNAPRDAQVRAALGLLGALLYDGGEPAAEALCEALRAADLLVEVQEVFAEA